MEKEDFIRRLVELRMNKGVSARDMSLSIGQSAGYINNIENGVNLPSMTVFFYICEYLDITPKEFFDTEECNPTKLNDLLSAAKGMNNEQLEHLIAIAKWIK
ncbi:MAG: helix-turn-helix domain-containing protein [Eubacteriales bacterium]